MLVGLLPDLLALLDIIGGVDGIVDAHDHHQQPGQRDQEAVRVQGMDIVRLATGKGVIGRHDGSLEGEKKEGQDCVIYIQTEMADPRLKFPPLSPTR